MTYVLWIQPEKNQATLGPSERQHHNLPDDLVTFKSHLCLALPNPGRWRQTHGGFQAAVTKENYAVVAVYNMYFLMISISSYT